jgi:sugar lactone lactonase YvrE
MKTLTLTCLTLGLFAAEFAATNAQAANPIVPDGAKLEKLFTRETGVEGGLTEGPAVAPDGSIYFSDITMKMDKGRILRFDPKSGKTTIFKENSGKSNGLAFDAHGRLLACEGSDYGGRAVSRYDISTGKREVLCDNVGGNKLNAPNDLVLDADGRVYFSDPRYLGHETRELKHRAVYRIDTDGSVVEVTHEVEKPNGIALSPDQKTLYVVDHNNGTDRIGFGDKEPKPGAMKVYAFPLGADGLVNGARKTLVDFGKEHGCDGICIDAAGNLYLTSRSMKKPGVMVIDPKGKELAFIATGPANQDHDATPVGLPSNVEFGIGSEISTLYVTVGLTLQRIKLKSPGFHIPFFDADADHSWTRIELDPAFRSEGVAVGDLNGDGRNDVVAGDVWYEAPKKIGAAGWKMHGFRPVGSFVAGKGYSNSFCNYVHDLDQDGKQDIIVVGFPGAPFHWYRNPGKASDKWDEHEIWHSICNESPEFADITGDGQPEFVFGSAVDVSKGSPEQGEMGFCSIPAKGDVIKKWKFNTISNPGPPHENGTFKYYHGLGHGDLNNDGRTDVLIAHGWWEQPKNATSGQWAFHPYALAKDGVHPEKLSDIHVEDLDMDGDQDLIGSSAHAHGVWWFENVGGNKKPQFKAHTIDESHSQTHAMEYVDINGDGQKDIVTGKRFYAHNGGDPGARDTTRMFWYEVKRAKGKAPTFTRHEIAAGRDTGIGTQFLTVDFDGDGDLDIALGNKKGVNLLIHN